MWFALLGLSIGLACLLKSSFVLLGAGAIAGLVVHFRRRWRDLWVPVRLRGLEAAGAVVDEGLEIGGELGIGRTAYCVIGRRKALS